MTKKHKFRNTLILILLSILLFIIIIGILLCDFSDNTPSYTKEVEDLTIGDYLGDKAKKSANETGAFDDFEYLFNEEELNNVLALVTKTISIPMVKIKSIYLDIKDTNEIYIEAPFWALFYKSMAKANCYLSYDDETVRLVIEDIRIRNFTSTKGIVKSILDDDCVADIEKSINDAGVVLDMWKEDSTIFFEMSNLDIVKTIINCTKGDGVGFLTAALVAGTLNSNSIDIVINENGFTGIIVHKFLL